MFPCGVEGGEDQVMGTLEKQAKKYLARCFWQCNETQSILKAGRPLAGIGVGVGCYILSMCTAYTVIYIHHMRLPVFAASTYSVEFC